MPLNLGWRVEIEADAVRVPPEVMDQVVFLYPTEEDAKGHTPYGGTGFILGKPVYKNGRHTGLYVPYLITNKHLTTSPWVRVNRRDGKEPDIFEIDERLWVTHPDGDDVAAIPVIGRLDMTVHKVSMARFDYLIDEKKAAEYQLGLGEEVFMVGRFVNHQGRIHNVAALRFGCISVMPEPIYNKAMLHDQLSYAVEMRSRTGFSGSPVIVYRTPATVLDGAVKTPDFWGVLGLNWGYIYDENGENTWLNGVVPAWKILELMNSEKLSSFHEEVSKRAPIEDAAEPAAASPPRADAVEPATDNPSHKEDFMQLLGAASKAKSPAS